jgi:hypothetical protein
MSASRRGGGAADAQPAPGGGRDTEAKVRQQEDKDATHDLFLKHPEATLATYV